MEVRRQGSGEMEDTMPTPTPNRPHILVVEDNFLVAREVCEIVQRTGFDVVGPVARSDHGMTLLAEQSVEGAIIDIGLGAVTSFPICEELNRRHVPFVFLTGYERDVIPRAFRQAPVLSKPAQAREIQAALTALRCPGMKARADEPAAGASKGKFDNLLLDTLEPEDRKLLASCLEPVRLVEGQILAGPDKPASHVWFPSSGLIGVLAQTGDRCAEVAMIGREGLAGLSAVLDGGGAGSAHRIVVRFPGDAWRVSVRALMPVLVRSRRLHGHLLRYADAFIAELALNALTAGQARVQERVACWLLTAADRLGRDELPVTHGALAQALGVRRAGVTVALHWLEGAHAIRSERARVRIVDRTTLEAEAAGFYRPPDASRRTHDAT
jgi:CRP-like cAMP-binding protein/CheY-like chemotaxis protein